MKKIPICNLCKLPCMFKSKHFVLIDDTKECPYAGMFNRCRHPKGRGVYCQRYLSEIHGRCEVILGSAKCPPPKNCPLEDAKE